MALRNALLKPGLPMALLAVALVISGFAVYYFFFADKKKKSPFENDYEDDDDKKKKKRYFCYDKNTKDHVGTVDTWWGGNSAAEWACNEWIGDCNKNCFARKPESNKEGKKGGRRFRGSKSRYNCFLNDTKVGKIDSWWGGKADALWACNEWVPECGKSCTSASAA